MSDPSHSARTSPYARDRIEPRALTDHEIDEIAERDIAIVHLLAAERMFACASDEAWGVGQDCACMIAILRQSIADIRSRPAIEAQDAEDREFSS